METTPEKQLKPRGKWIVAGALAIIAIIVAIGALLVPWIYGWGHPAAGHFVLRDEPVTGAAGDFTIERIVFHRDAAGNGIVEVEAAYSGDQPAWLGIEAYYNAPTAAGSRAGTFPLDPGFEGSATLPVVATGRGEAVLSLQLVVFTEAPPDVTLHLPPDAGEVVLDEDFPIPDAQAASD